MRNVIQFFVETVPIMERGGEKRGEGREREVIHQVPLCFGRRKY